MPLKVFVMNMRRNEKALYTNSCLTSDIFGRTQRTGCLDNQTTPPQVPGLVEEIRKSLLDVDGACPMLNNP